MMEKVKLTEWQKDAIEDLLQEYRKENIVSQHVLGRWGDAYDSLNKLGLDEIVRALYVGYAVESEYKLKDWVYSVNSSSVGQLVRVGDSFVEMDNGNIPSFNFVRHATPEEIKSEQERRVWAGIGREVNEWRKGDVYVHRRYAEAYAIDHKDALRLASERYEEGLVIGIYPYESFISFGGESHDN